MMDVTVSPEIAPINSSSRRKRSLSPAPSHGAPASGSLFGTGPPPAAAPRSPGRSKMTRTGLKTVSPWSSNRLFSSSSSQGAPAEAGEAVGGHHGTAFMTPQQEQQPPATTDYHHADFFNRMSASTSARAAPTACSTAIPSPPPAAPAAPASFATSGGPVGDTHEAQEKRAAAEAAEAGGRSKNVAFSHADELSAKDMKKDDDTMGIGVDGGGGGGGGGMGHVASGGGPVSPHARTLG